MFCISGTKQRFHAIVLMVAFIVMHLFLSLSFQMEASDVLACPSECSVVAAVERTCDNALVPDRNSRLRDRALYFSALLFSVFAAAELVADEGTVDYAPSAIRARGILTDMTQSFRPDSNTVLLN